MCLLPKSVLSKNPPQRLPIHNEHLRYNCQDYVLELLDGLEERGITGGTDAIYQKQKEVVTTQQEALRG